MQKGWGLAGTRGRRELRIYSEQVQLWHRERSDGDSSVSGRMKVYTNSPVCSREIMWPDQASHKSRREDYCSPTSPVSA